MLGQTKPHVVFPGCGLPQCTDIFSGTDIYRVILVDFGVIVKEVVMMCCLCDKIPGSCLIVKLH